MQPEQEFQYLFMDDQGRYVYEKPDRTVDFSAIPAPLKYSPDGWSLMSLSWERNSLRHGIIRTVSVPLKFVNDGARILRKYYHDYGYEAHLTLVIAKFNSSNYLHELFFNGDINFETIVDETATVTVEILDGGINAKLKAKMETPFEIDITPYKSIRHDGLKIKQSTTWSVTNGTDLTTPFAWRNNHLLDIFAVQQESNPLLSSTQTVERFKVNPGDSFNTGKYGLRAKVNTTVHFEWDFNMNITYDPSGGAINPAARTRTDIRRYDVNGNFVDNHWLWFATGAFDVLGNKHLVGTFDYILNAGDSLFFTSWCTVIGVDGDASMTWDYTDGGQIAATFFSRAAATIVRGMPLADLFEALIRKIDNTFVAAPILFTVEAVAGGGGHLIKISPKPAVPVTFGSSLVLNLSGGMYIIPLTIAGGVFDGGTYIQFSTGMGIPTTPGIYPNSTITVNGALITNQLTYSALLSSRLARKVVISGDALRGFTDAKIKISLGDFLKGVDTIGCIGFGTRNNAPIVEQRQNFYSNNIILDLGEIKDFTVKNASEFGCNEIKIGYPPFEYDEINGRDEFNTTSVWSTTIKRIVRLLDLVSPIRADMYGAEFARVNYSNKLTSDASSDNDNWFLDLTENPLEGHYNLYRAVYDTITGLLNPDTAYNIELSPERCLREHAAWLRGLFTKLDLQSMSFQTTSKNHDLYTSLAGVIHDEDADIPISSLTSAYIDLKFLIFKTRTPINMPLLLANLSNGLVKFTCKGNDYYGWIMKVDIQPHTLEEKEFKLLAKAGQNLNINTNE